MPPSQQNQLPFLHESADFNQLLAIVAQEKSIAPQQVEKDYWLMHCLYGLTQAGIVFDLKGGTSLSKGYNIIERFSEDIDIRVEPSTGLPTKSSQVRAGHVKKRSIFFDTLQQHIQIPGILAVERDTDFDDKTLRNVGIRLIYPTLFNPLLGLKIGILLEIGFDDTEPNTPRNISSWAFDWAEATGLQPGVDIEDNRAQSIRCYHPGYTFVEKLQAVSTKYRNERKGSGMPVNFLRHYYDIYALLAVPEVQAFIGTERYHQRKVERFRKEDNPDIKTNEAFILTDPQVKQKYAAEYLRIRELFYVEPPTFDEILERIQTHIKTL